MKYLIALALLVVLAACTPVVQTDTDLNHDHMSHDESNHDFDGMHMDFADMPMGSMMIASEEEFVVEMIPHHQEAVDTSRIIFSESSNEELVDLANRIIIAQEAEITMMQGWVVEYYGGGYESDYTNMMGDLTVLSGNELDESYIKGMIMHHMMAVMMARQVLALDPSDHVQEFAQGVIITQTAEIHEMQVLLRAY
jgi:uncharacterized protein (DUF305 family)